MKRNYNVDEDNRLINTTEYPFNEGLQFFDFPEDFDYDNQHDYKIIGRELIYDPIPVETIQDITMQEILNVLTGGNDGT